MGGGITDEDDEEEEDDDEEEESAEGESSGPRLWKPRITGALLADTLVNVQLFNSVRIVGGVSKRAGSTPDWPMELYAEGSVKELEGKVITDP